MSLKTPKQLVAAFKKYGSLKAASRETKTAWGSVHKLYIRALADGLMEAVRPGSRALSEIADSMKTGERKVKPHVGGRKRILRAVPLERHPEKVTRFLFTCAQNNTKIHEPFWDNLLKLKEHYNAELHVSRFAYIRTGLGARGDKQNYFSNINASGQKKGGPNPIWFDERIEPYVSDNRREVAPGLVWCGESNIIPTAARPLSGLETYTGRRSSIFPHVKIAMDSIPSALTDPTKFNYTTGTITQRNYIQRKEGLKAEFHHCFHPDTKYITRDGIKTFRESVGANVEVWSGTDWQNAEIKSFGVQSLNEITLVPAVQQNCNGTFAYRAQSSKVVHRLKVTPDHGWHLADGAYTRDLKDGDVIPASTVCPVNEGQDFEEGVRHGLIFGDGSVVYKSLKTNEFSHQVCLHGDAACTWSHLFDHITRWPSREHIHNYGGTAYHKAMHNYKELPVITASPAYIRGFFVGWIAADGHINKRDKCVQLCSVTKYALEWAVEHAPYAGFVATGFCKGCGDFTTFGELREPLWRLTLADTPRFWKVAGIKPAGESEVMCAVVNPSHKFTLASGILTGNCYGALLVEVSPDGDWWCRQINGDSEGTIYDLDICVKKGVIATSNKVTAHKRGYDFVEESFVEGVKWGDVHEKQMDPAVRESAWGEGGMLDTLRPRYQFLDDTFDMFARNHHDIDNPFTMLKRYVTGEDDVREEAVGASDFIVEEAHRSWLKATVITNSNHDRALMRWLRNKHMQHDPVNIAFWHKMNTRVTQHIAETGSTPIILREAFLEVLGLDKEPKGIVFLAQDEGFIICPNAGGGVENGFHGDDGPNGSKGTTLSFAKHGRKINKGHDHVAAIIDSAYSSGCCLNLKNPPDYAHGPSSWSNSHVITYINGKRQIVTMWGENRQPWADRD